MRHTTLRDIDMEHLISGMLEQERDIRKKPTTGDSAEDRGAAEELAQLLRGGGARSAAACPLYVPTCSLSAHILEFLF